MDGQHCLTVGRLRAEAGVSDRLTAVTVETAESSTAVGADTRSREVEAMSGMAVPRQSRKIPSERTLWGTSFRDDLTLATQSHLRGRYSKQ